MNYSVKKQTESFPILPTVAARVLEITASPKDSRKEMVRVIESDQSLTAAILKLANSAFFGLPREVISLDQALMLLGVTEVQNLVLAKAVFDSFAHLKTSSSFNLRSFWRHSFLCGLAVKVMGRGFRGVGEDFFVAGLLHDIGKLTIYLDMPREFDLIIKETESLSFSTLQAERKILETTHDEVALRLLNRWMFPEILVTAVGFHHRPRLAGKYALFPLLVQLADLLAHLGFSQSEDRKVVLFEKDVFNPEIVELTRSHGVPWNFAAIKRYRHELLELAAEEADILSLFHS